MIDSPFLSAETAWTPGRVAITPSKKNLPPASLSVKLKVVIAVYLESSHTHHHDRFSVLADPDPPSNKKPKPNCPSSRTAFTNSPYRGFAKRNDTQKALPAFHSGGDTSDPRTGPGF